MNYFSLIKLIGKNLIAVVICVYRMLCIVTWFGMALIGQQWKKRKWLAVVLKKLTESFLKRVTIFEVRFVKV